jgi:hypothetical protein
VKAPSLLIALLAALAAGAASAQAAAPGANPAVAPTEPDIVMPQVILQIEDLSVEKVEAQLPPEEELLPPERKIPVLSEGDLAIGEPTITGAAADTETTTGNQRDRFLASAIDLGAGMLNGIKGSISLKTLGADPRFSLRFDHETLDGLSWEPPGSGFNMRIDALDGTLKLKLGGIVDAELGGSFLETETGLQGHALPYVARLARVVAGSTSFSATPLDWLSLRAGLEGSYDSLTLTGSVPLQLEGLRVAPSLAAQARFGSVKAGLETRYDFRVDPATSLSAGGPLHRFQASASFGADLPATFILEGSAGWFWNSDGLSLVPFTVAFTGTPFDFMTLSLEVGYRVDRYDMQDLLAVHPLSLPNSVADDRGWFGDSSFQFTITRDLAATLKLSYMASDALAIGVGVQNPGTGLFAVTQRQGMRLSSDVGVRWGITQSVSVSAGWTHQYIDRLFFTPQDSWNAELIGLEPAGRFGGSLSISLAPTPTGDLQPPVVRASGFWKISEFVKLRLDGDDLLWPLLGGGRFDIPPYVKPGLRISGSLSMSL